MRHVSAALLALCAFIVGACAGIQGRHMERPGATETGWAATLLAAGLGSGPTLGSPELETAMADADAYYGMPAAPGGRALARLGARGADCAVHLRLPAAEPLGLLLFIHGYREHGLSSPALARLALESGWAFAGLDLPGHGASPGSEGTIEDFAEYGRVLGAALQAGLVASGLPVLIVGFSTGGAAAVEYLSALGADSPARRERYLLLSPLVRTRAWWPSRLGLALGAWAMPLLPDRTLGVSHDRAWSRLARVDPLRVRRAPIAWVRALVRWQASLKARPPRPETPRIVWAGDDTVISPSYGRRALGRLFPGARQDEIEGAWHGLPFEGGTYLEALLALVGEELVAASASEAARSP